MKAKLSFGTPIKTHVLLQLQSFLFSVLENLSVAVSNTAQVLHLKFQSLKIVLGLIFERGKMKTHFMDEGP